MYKVIAYFTDLQDDGHEYHAGDIFPRSGLAVTDERIAELSSANNKRGKALIKDAQAKLTSEEKPAKQKRGKKNAK